MSRKEHKGKGSLPLNGQREIRLGNDEDVIIIDTDGELTSPEDLPDISLQKLESDKRTPVTHKSSRPTNKSTRDTCKGTPNARQYMAKSGHPRPSTKTERLDRTPKLHQNTGGHKSTQSTLRTVQPSSCPDICVLSSTSKSSPNPPSSYRLPTSTQVECVRDTPRSAKASLTPQQQARKSVDCADLFSQLPHTAPERSNSLKSMHSMGRKREGSGSVEKRRHVVTPELMDHTRTYRKGVVQTQAVSKAKGKGPHFDISSLSDSELSHKVKSKYGNGKSTPSDGRHAAISSSSPVVSPSHVGPRNASSSKTHPTPSTLKHQNSHSPMKSKHKARPPPIHLSIPPTVKSKKLLNPSLTKSSSPSVVPTPSNSSPVSSKPTPNHSLSSSNVPNKTVKVPTSKDSETESSSMFDFNDNDLFEVLDSVESESICSAYNQSDSESMDTAGEGKTTSEPAQVETLNTAKAATCKSPSESRVRDFAMSFMKKRKRQVAKKSTTLNGMKCFRHPVKGRGFVHLNHLCALRLSRIHSSTLQRAKKEMARHVAKAKEVCIAPIDRGSVHVMTTDDETSPNLPQDISTSIKTLGKKKRETKSQDFSAAPKRPKLSPAGKVAEQPPAKKMPVLASTSTASGSLTNAPLPVTYVKSSGTSNSEALSEQVSLNSQHKAVVALKENKTVIVVKLTESSPPERALPPVDGTQGKQLDALSSQKRPSHVPSHPHVASSQSHRPLPLILKGSRKKGEHGNNTFSPYTRTGPIQQKLHTHMKATSSMPGEKAQVSASNPSSNTSVAVASGPQTPLSCVTPEKRPSSTEPSTTPVGKCLSLKRHQSQQTPPAKEATKKVDDNKTTASIEASVTCETPETQGAPLLDGCEVVPTKEKLVITAVATTDTTSQQILGTNRDCRERKLSSSSDKGSSAMLSPRNEAYDSKLLETIAKLAPGSGTNREDTAAGSSGLSSRYAVADGMEGELDGKPSPVEGSELDTLMVKLPLSQLARTPAAVTTTPLGMFREKSVQVENGMIFDKDALDGYLVVKLHEAMFEMKTQLQMMETQVASIAKQKQSLERTLQAKTKYIQDITTTGFRPSMVDKCVSTDPTFHLSPDKTTVTSAAAPQTKKHSTPTKRRSVKTAEKGVQTQVRNCVSVSSQTEGVVRTVPARLKTSSRPMCLYKHPDSELQLFIDSQSGAHSRDDSLDNYLNGENPLDLDSKHNWLSTSVEGKCARSVPINPCVRFVKAVQDSSAVADNSLCAVHSNRPFNGTQSGEDTPPTGPHSVQPSSNTAVPAAGPSVTCTCNSKKVEWRSECISSPLRNCVSRLVELFNKLKALPTEPVQENHMASLLRALHHLLSHLPVEISSSETINSPSAITPTISPSPVSVTSPASPTPSITTPATPSSATSKSTMTPMTPPSATAKFTMTPMTPPSALPLPSPPSTPGAASWSIGAKLQELVDVLQELGKKGRDVFPKYFKAELAQLQIKVCETLTFLTVGLQHETFTHDRSGCIVDSDLQSRPWRDRDLQMDPYFRRLCLDIGVRALMQEVKRLMQQRQSGKRFTHHTCTSDEDSDPEPRSRTSSSSKARKTSTNKSKGASRKTRYLCSRTEAVHAYIKRKSPKGGVRCLTLPSSSGARSAGSTTTISVTPLSTSSATDTVCMTSPSSTSTTSFPSLLQLSPYNKQVHKGDSFQVRIGDLPSVTKANAVATMSGTLDTTTTTTTVVNSTTTLVNTTTTVVYSTVHNITTAPMNTIPVNTHTKANTMVTSTITSVVGSTTSTVGVNTRPIVTDTTAIVAAGGSTMALTTTLAAVKTNTVAVSCSTAVSAVNRVTTSTTSSYTSAVTASTTANFGSTPSFTASHSKAQPLRVSDLLSLSHQNAQFSLANPTELRNTLLSLQSVVQSAHFVLADRASVQKLIDTAFQLTISPYSRDLQLVQLLINQIRYKLQQAIMKALPSWNTNNRTSASVFVQPLLPLSSVISPSSLYPFTLKVPSAVPTSVMVSCSMVGLLSPPVLTTSSSNTVTAQSLSVVRAPGQGTAACTTSSLPCSSVCVSQSLSSSITTTAGTTSTTLSLNNNCTLTSSKLPTTTAISSAADSVSCQPSSQPSTTTQTPTTSLSETRISTASTAPHPTNITHLTVPFFLPGTVSSSSGSMKPLVIHHVPNPSSDVLSTTATTGHSEPHCITTVPNTAPQGPPTTDKSVMNIVTNSTSLSTKATTSDNRKPILTTGSTAKPTTTTTARSASLPISFSSLVTFLAREEMESKRKVAELCPPSTTSTALSSSHSQCSAAQAVQVCAPLSSNGGSISEGISPTTTSLSQTMGCDNECSLPVTCTTASTEDREARTLSVTHTTPVMSTCVATVAKLSVSRSAIGEVSTTSTAQTSAVSSMSDPTSQSLPVSRERAFTASSLPRAVSPALTVALPGTAETAITTSVVSVSLSHSSASVSAVAAGIDCVSTTSPTTHCSVVAGSTSAYTSGVITNPTSRHTPAATAVLSKTLTSTPITNTATLTPAASPPTTTHIASTTTSAAPATGHTSRPAANNTSLSKPSGGSPSSTAMAKSLTALRLIATNTTPRPAVRNLTPNPTARIVSTRPPFTTPATVRPATATATVRPATTTAAPRPAATTAATRPSATTAAIRPSATTAATRPSATTAVLRPVTTQIFLAPRPAATIPLSNPLKLRLPATCTSPVLHSIVPHMATVTTAQRGTSSNVATGYSSGSHLCVTTSLRPVTGRSAATIITSVHSAASLASQSTATTVTTSCVPTSRLSASQTHTCGTGVSTAVNISLPLISSSPIFSHSAASVNGSLSAGGTNISTDVLRSSSCAFAPPALRRQPLGQSYPLPQLVHPPTDTNTPSSSRHTPLHQLVQQHGAPPTVIVQASKVANGLLIKWTFASKHLPWQTSVQRYELYAYVCKKGSSVPDISQWGKVGEIKPLALPMAVTLTNFAVGQCYAFAVRVNYCSGVSSTYSDPCTIDL